MDTTGVKRSHSGKLDGRDEKKLKENHPEQQPKADPIIMKQCTTILRELIFHKHGWVFNKPVDYVKLEIPDYPKVIKNPMDLGTIKNKIEKNEYSDPRDFAADVRLTFANVRKYYPPANDVHVMAVRLSELFESKWRFLEKKLPDVAPPSRFMNKVAQSNLVPKPHQQLQQQQQQPIHDKVTEKPKQSNKPKAAPAPLEHKPKLESNKRPISMEEKQKLSRDLESFSDMPELIVDFLRKHSDLSQSEDEIEIDFDVFDNGTLLELRKLVTNCLNRRNQHFAAKNLPKAEPSEAELPSGLSQGDSSPVHNRKCGDPGEEDVAIGENDLPASHYSPRVIEKDTAGRNSKCSSSSSSSSDSGSSFSDLDAASFSSSDSDLPNAPSPNAVSKEPMGKGAECNQRTSPSVETPDATMDAWLNRYDVTPMAPIGSAPLSLQQQEQLPQHDIVDIVDLDEGSTHLRELELDPPHDMVVRGEESEGRALTLTQHAVSETHGESDTIEQFLMDMQTGARRIVASAQELAHDRADQAVERLLAFATGGCAEEFVRCFNFQGWPAMETPAMLEDWRLPEPVGESRTHSLLRRVEQAFRDEYYELRRVQHSAAGAEAERVAAIVAREELATRLRMVEDELVQQRVQVAALEEQLDREKVERAAVETRLIAALEEIDKKHKEVMEAVFMVKTARERQLLAERDLQRLIEQVQQLSEQLAASTSPVPSSSGTLSRPPAP